jgi:hypothetical protein
MSFRPMFHFDGGEVTGNSLYFATRAEAEASAYDKFQVWTLPHDWSVMETNDPVSHAYIDGRVFPIDNPAGEPE